MSASMSLEQKLEAFLKNKHTISISNQEFKDSNQELKAQNEYLRRQLGELMQHKQKMHEPIVSYQGEREEAASNPFGSSIEDEPLIITKRKRRP